MTPRPGILGMLLLSAAGAAAQTTGTIEGRVSDLAGAPLDGVRLEASSPSLQGVRDVASDGAGSFHLPALPPGRYTVRASKTGFKAAEKTATVSLDATQAADFVLEPVIEENVTVSGSAPPIDETSTTGGTSYTNAVIDRLPVSRNYADIVSANPGVSSDRGETQGRSLTLAVYGATSAENQWIIDGVNTTNVILGLQGKAINNEFVQEVEVKTGGYGAEYGHALGGVVNVITRSGGNELHGGAFVYYDSNGTSNRQINTPEDSQLLSMHVVGYQRADFGADLGGYLVKDRLWFFGAYNRVDEPGEISRWESAPLVPTSDRFPLNSTENLYSGKLTWSVATGMTLVATVFGDPSETTGASGQDPRQGFGALSVIPPILNPEPTTWESTRNVGDVDYSARLEQLLGPLALVTLQASRHQDRYQLSAADLVRTTDLTCPGGTPGNPCAFDPRSPSGVEGGFGLINGPGDNSRSQRGQLAASAAFFVGNHDLKFGGDYETGKTDAVYLETGGQGVYLFNPYGQLFYGHQYFAVSSQDLTPVASANLVSHFTDTSIYGQDSWRIGPSWTLNVGLRWDEQDIRNHQNVTALKTTAEWQPRIGVVWNPDGAGTTKIYAFAGRFYYTMPQSMAVTVFGGGTEVRAYNFSPTSLAQDPNAPIGIQVFSGSDPVDAGIRAMSQDELTVGVERLLDPTLTVALKGTYRRLNDVIEDRCDLDYTSPLTDYSSCGIMNPGSSGTIAQGNLPGCDGISQCTPTVPATPPASRIYRGIELMVRKVVGSSLWVQASYVYSSLRGNYDGAISEGYFGQTNPGINYDFDYPAFWHDGYGRLFLDRPSRFRLDAAYTTPFHLTVGLQAYAQSGAPLNQVGFFNDSYGAAVQLVPKGDAGRLPTDWDANLTLSYPLVVGPATVTLQAYLFRLFNRQTPTALDTSWTTSQTANYPANLYDPNQPSNNPGYGNILVREPPRVFRAAVKVSF